MSNDFQLGPNTLMENCLIFVTFNYRLGAFGFLSLGRREYSGNMGMKDQQMALRWMNKNINAFGGDPDNVMIFGNSAGKCSNSLDHIVLAHCTFLQVLPNREAFEL